MRVRTTAAALAVVGIVLLVGALTLVAMVRGSLREAVETNAEQRAEALADQIDASGLPDEGTRGHGDGDDLDDDGDDDLDELVWQVSDEQGRVVRASPGLVRELPVDDADEMTLSGADSPYVVVVEDARVGDEEYDVTVAASLEDVEESMTALVTPLVVGLPLLLLLVGGTTWMVVSRALAPVERIRAEVEQITGDRLDRRVPEPRSRDEIHRLAQTMNQMLGRLQDSRDRQRQFVGDASHELRSPLASIRQTAEVSRAHPGSLPEGELAEAVLEEGARMQRLVEQLLLLTQADEGALQRAEHDVDLDDVALSAARRVRRPGLTVDTSGIQPGRIRGDRGGLDQVARNLVENAARHARSRIQVTVQQIDAGVELVVEDNGSGIAEADRERVFERFVRLDEARARDVGGSGLGLAIVSDIVAAHGGSVEAAASEHGGARFVVRLPAPAHRPA